MAKRAAVCHALGSLCLGVLLLGAPTAVEAQERRTVTVGAEIVECANTQALEAANRLLADQPVSFVGLRATVVRDSPLFQLSVLVRPLKREESSTDEAGITATIHFPAN